MAMVIRRYRFVGTEDSRLLKVVSLNPAEVSVAAVFTDALVDINVDNAVVGLTDVLDDAMTELNFDVTTTKSPKQVFTYTAVGGEANPFTIALPATRYSTNYNVQVSICRALANAIKVPSIVSGTMTATQFDVELSAPIEVGDVLCFTVEDLT